MDIKIFRIPVRITLAYVLLIAFYSGIFDGYSNESILIAIIASVSLLIHELGHAFAAKYFGLSPQIVLHGLGGYTSFSENLSQTKKFITTLAGPAFQALLILFAYLAREHLVQANQVEFQKVLFYTISINRFWLLLNLIPIYPLDGGQLVENTLGTILGEKGLNAARLIGMSSLFIAIPWLLLSGSYFFAIFLCYLSAMRYHKHMNYFIKGRNGQKSKIKISLLTLLALVSILTSAYLHVPKFILKKEKEHQFLVLLNVQAASDFMKKFANKYVPEVESIDKKIYLARTEVAETGDIHAFDKKLKNIEKQISRKKEQLLRNLEVIEKEHFEIINYKVQSKYANHGIEYLALSKVIRDEYKSIKKNNIEKFFDLYSVFLSKSKELYTPLLNLKLDHSSEQFQEFISKLEIEVAHVRDWRATLEESRNGEKYTRKLFDVLNYSAILKEPTAGKS